jgi:ATP-dependent Clp protease ATP-binding subunit ClpA
MQNLVQPRWGFSTAGAGDDGAGAQMTRKLSAAGTAAARKKFTPEFVNRLDAMVVFHPLGEAELRQIAEIELRRVQQRILSSGANPFVFQLTEAAVDHVLVEGTDPRYGARHLRRAIDRLLVQPISNLLATDQVRRGDCLRVDSDPESREIVFSRHAEALSSPVLARLAQTPVLAYRSQAAAASAQPQPAGIRRRFDPVMESNAA